MPLGCFGWMLAIPKSVAVREWHGWVGNVITLAMAFRVFIPQAGRQGTRWYCELAVWETITIEHLQHCYTIWTYTDYTVILIAILWQPEFLMLCHTNTEAMESRFRIVRFPISWTFGAGNAIADARPGFRAESNAYGGDVWRYSACYSWIFMRDHKASMGGPFSRKTPRRHGRRSHRCQGLHGGSGVELLLDLPCSCQNFISLYQSI